MKIEKHPIAINLLLQLLMLSCSADNKKLPPPLPDTTIVAKIENFKSNRILIKHGLQIQCWLASDNFELAGKKGQPAYVMLPSDWEQTGFTAPTFFGPPLINPSFFQYFPNSQWAIAKAPHGDHLKESPTDDEKRNGFLTENHKKTFE